MPTSNMSAILINIIFILLFRNFIIKNAKWQTLPKAPRLFFIKFADIIRKNDVSGGLYV